MVPYRGHKDAIVGVLRDRAKRRYTRRKATTVSTWANQLLERKPARLVTVAVANKVARIPWAVMAREENYRATSSMARG